MSTPSPRRSRVQRVAALLKGISVTTALVFFVALGLLWWALRTGRAVEYVRSEIVAQARDACGVSLAFDSFKFDMVPPVIHLSGVVVDDVQTHTRFASVREAQVELEALPLMYGRIQIDRAALLAPTATLLVRGSTIANLPRCLAPDPNAPPTPIPIVLGVRELRIERATLDVIVPDQAELRISEIDVTLGVGSGGGADLALAVEGSTVTLPGATIAVPRVRMLAHIAGALTQPRAISIESLEVTALGGRLSVAGSIDLLGPVYEANAELDLPLASIPALMDGLPAMRGRLNVKGQFAGTAAEPRGLATIIVDGGHVGDFTVADHLEVDLRADRRTLGIPRIEVKLGEGRVHGAGSIALEAVPRLSLDLDLQRLPFGRLLSCLNIKSAWIDWLADGKISASGPLVPLGIGGDVTVALDRFRVWDRGWDKPEIRGGGAEHLLLSPGLTTVDGTWTADPDGFWIKDARIERGTITGTATARVNPNDLADLYVVGRFDPWSFEDLGPIAGVPLTGRGVIDAVIRAPETNVGGSAQLTLDGVSVAGIPLGDARSKVRWIGTSVHLDELEATLSRSHYRADAQLDFVPSFVLTARGVVDDGRLEDVLLPFHEEPDRWGHPSAAMTARFDVKGPLKKLDGLISGELRDIVVVGERLEHGTLDLHFDKGVIGFEDIVLNKHGAQITGRGTLDPATDAVSAQLVTKNLTLQKVDVMAQSSAAIDAPLDLRLDLGGHLTALTGTLTADLGEGHAGRVSLGKGRLDGHFHDRALDVRGKIVGGALSVDGTVELLSGLPYKARLQLDGYDAPRLVSALATDAEWTGLLAGTAELSGSLVDWAESAGSVVVERGRFDPLTLELIGPTRMSLADGVLATKRIVVQAPSSRLVGSGQLGRRTDLRVQGRVDLSSLPTFFPQVEQSGGVLSLDAVVRGEGGELDLLGTGRVDRALLEWRGVPGRLTAASAQLAFSRSTVLIERAEGRFAEGAVTATGEVVLDRMLPKSIRLETSLSNVRPRLVYPKFDLQGTLNGPVVMAGPFDRLEVRGHLVATRAVLRPKLEWRSLIADPSRRLAPSVYDPDKEVMNFDLGVAIHADDPLRVRNDTAQLEMWGDVSLTGTNQRIGMLGTLAVGRGRVGFIGREYSFESGTIELRDRYAWAPRFDLQLGARACDAQITLNLVGTLDDVSTSYSSKPEMEDTNIVSCLVRGVRVRDLENIRGDNRGSAAASLAGEALWRLSGVDQEVRKVLPVDQIEVTTEYSARDRVYEPRILVAKELGDGRFRLEYSSSLVKNDEQRAAVRYRITPKLTLQYTWASSEDITVGDHGVDLKYRWEW